MDGVPKLEVHRRLVMAAAVHIAKGNRPPAVFCSIFPATFVPMTSPYFALPTWSPAASC